MLDSGSITWVAVLTFLLQKESEVGEGGRGGVGGS